MNDEVIYAAWVWSGRVEVVRLEVEKRTARQIVLKRSHGATGYRKQLPISEAYPTAEVALSTLRRSLEIRVDAERRAVALTERALADIDAMRAEGDSDAG